MGFDPALVSILSLEELNIRITRILFLFDNTTTLTVNPFILYSLFLPQELYPSIFHPYPSYQGQRITFLSIILQPKGFLLHHQHTNTNTEYSTHSLTHSTTMTACSYRDASSYAPVFPSPLNPTNHGPENKYGPARIVRRRRTRAGRRGPPGSHTLTQRFLRVKAADAWRGHVLSAQVAQYEYAEAAAMSIKGSKHRVSSFFYT